MNYFKKLDGFQRSPAGLEWEIWKKLRLILATGTAPPLIAGSTAFLLEGMEYTRSVEQFSYVMVGLVILHWSLVLTLAIGCAIVILMKGPAYVADAYIMEEPSLEHGNNICKN
jgi:hypothetical protein